MAVPDFQTLMLPVLRAAAAGETTVADCIEKIASELKLTPAEIEQLLPSGKQTLLSNRVHWAKFYMTRAHLLEPVKRGQFRITDRGKTLLASKPAKIDRDILRQYPKFLVWWEKAQGSEKSQKAQSATEHVPANDIAADSETPEERLEALHAILETQLRLELLDRVIGVSAASFERLMVQLLLAMGYGGGRADMGKALGRAGDGGVDGVVREDELGLDVVYIQAKRYAPDNVVGRPAIQAFVGSLEGERATKGVFVTTSSFSKQATDYAKQIGKRVVLIDGEELAHLMMRHSVGVRTKTAYEVKKIDEDVFGE